MARYHWESHIRWTSAALSTTLHGVVIAAVVIGLPDLLSAPVKLEPPIPVMVVVPDNAVGFMAPDPERNVWPGETPALTGEGLAAPEGDVEDAPTSTDTTTRPPSDASAGGEAAAAALALEGEPNDTEGRDALPVGDTPAIAAGAAATAGPVLGEQGAAPPAPGARESGPLAASASSAAVTIAQADTSAAPAPSDTPAPPVEGGGSAASDRIAEWMPERPDSLADVSEILRCGLAEMRDELDRGDVPPETRARALQSAAEQGDLESQYELAVRYQLGLGVPRDAAMAVAWYREAAEKRLVDAQIHLGGMLASGDGVAAAPVEGQAWWSLAAKSGDPVAVAGAELLSLELTPLERAEARKLAERIDRLWTSWERWSSADSGGALDEQLIAAAGAGDVDEIKRLIDAGANPSAADARGRSAVLLSAINGHDEAADTLLRRGANVDTADADGKSALMWASDEGHVPVAKLLLKRGANIDARDKYGQTALIDAAWRGRDTIIDILLELGADPNARSVEGVTALMWAAINGYAGAARRLIAAGAEVDSADRDRFTPLNRAAWNGHTEVVAALLENGARVDAKSKDGKTALIPVGIE